MDGENLLMNISSETSCFFNVKQSHRVTGIRSSQRNECLINGDYSGNCPLGYSNTSLKILTSNSESIKVIVTSNSLLTESDVIAYLTEIVELLSSYLGIDETNGLYGTPYFKINYRSFDFKIKHKKKSRIDSSISCSSYGKLSRPVSLSLNQDLSVQDKNLLKFYYNGLRANDPRSKFFHWFLLIEYLENTKQYKELFPKGSLFSEEEVSYVQSLSEKMTGKQKAALNQALSRTEKSRKEKLLCFLNHFGINEIKNEKFSDKEIDKILKTRNRLVHNGSTFNEGILWNLLFPLVSQIIKKNHSRKIS